MKIFTSTETVVVIGVANIKKLEYGSGGKDSTPLGKFSLVKILVQCIGNICENLAFLGLHYRHRVFNILKLRKFVGW